MTTGKANAAIDLAAAEANGVTVCGTESPSSATPELTWALILSLVRHVPAESAGMREGQWQHSIGGDLYGHTLGIVGLGRLGPRVAAVGKAFGMRVLAGAATSTRAPRANAEPNRSASRTCSAIRRGDRRYKLSERSRGLIGHGSCPG